MKWSKKSTVFGAFLMGAVIFTTTAMADVIIGSGYYRLKETTKRTAATLVGATNSFEADVTMNLKIDGETYVENKSNIKYDVANSRMETNNVTNAKAEEPSKYYSYKDSEKNITRNDDGVYYVRELYDEEKNAKSRFLTDPFQEEMAQDAEKIVDAFVGNLKDIVQIEETDGKKMYTANLTETQVPTLVNAVSSFALKYSIMDDYSVKKMKIPMIKKDIYVREAAAKIVENQDGIIENGVGSINIIGKDENNVEHIFTLELGGSITGINATVVAEPNLEGQKVDYVENDRNKVSEKYIGKYKNDIVEENNGTFAKIGERTVEITSVDGEKLAGHYYETYNEGRFLEKAKSFALTGESDDRYGIKITYTDSDGTVRNGLINKNGRLGQNLNFQIGLIFEDNGSRSYNEEENTNYDSEFVRVFE